MKSSLHFSGFACWLWECSGNKENIWS